MFDGQGNAELIYFWVCACKLERDPSNTSWQATTNEKKWSNEGAMLIHISPICQFPADRHVFQLTAPLAWGKVGHQIFQQRPTESSISYTSVWMVWCGFREITHIKHAVLIYDVWPFLITKKIFVRYTDLFTVFCQAINNPDTVFWPQFFMLCVLLFLCSRTHSIWRDRSAFKDVQGVVVR